ncbi:MAG: prolyl-tRNA synthetase associated domain-containing protein [Candidatus Magasanikbacteria bacterium]|nr:prolyl-tRNA synthetase associated domain-containing protein [Candidatus Magasanikbacteria bacterium]
MNSVEQYLEDNHISYIMHEHPAVYTCEEAETHCGNIPGLACKNLLLKDQKGKRYVLVVLPATKRADIKKISETIGEKKMSFASAEAVKEKLGLEPGSVSPFGLLNDPHHEIELCIDQDVSNAEIVSFHPNRNTASIELTGDMFKKFLQTLPHNIYQIT